MLKNIFACALAALLPAGYCVGNEVIKNNSFTVSFDAAVSLETARKVSVTGKLPGKTSSFTMPENCVYDLKQLKLDYKPVTDQAIVYFEIVSPDKRSSTLGLAADYWYTCYVNGQMIGTTEPKGENVADISLLSPYNRGYKIELNKGINRVAIHTRPGNFSWSLACKLLPTLKDWPQEKFARDKFYEQLNQQILSQGVTGPFVMQLSTTSAAIALKMHYPEALYMVYNIQGQKPFMRKHNARYGILPRQEIHRFELTDLKPDTVYEYKIISADKFDKVITTGTFRTNPASTLQQSFIAFSDTQTSFAEREKIVRAMAAGQDGKKADMFVSLGDVAGMFDDFDRSYFDSYLVPFNETAPGKLFYPVRGNHEYRGADIDRYVEWFGQPYYAFRNGDVFYIVLDTGEDKPRSKKSPYTWRTYPKEFFAAQKEWLAKVVETDECKSAKKRIVLAHTTPFEWEKPYYAEHITYMCKDIFFGDAPRCKIDLWVCGDIHSPYRFDPATGEMAGSKRQATAKRTCSLSANDRKNLRFPIYVNDGPRGAGVDFTSTLVEIQGDIIRITCRDWQGNIMDKVQIAPGKPFKVLQTTFEKYIPYQNK